jgi:hypothetical protein
MTISVQVLAGMTIRKDITVGADNASNPQATITVGASTTLSDQGTTPDVEDAAGPRIALVAGAKVVDLTAVPDFNGGTVDGTGLQVRAIVIENPSTNTGDITITAGAAAAANGVDALGTTFTKVLKPGGRFIEFIPADAGTAISGTNKNIDVAGSGTEEFNIGVAFG